MILRFAAFQKFRSIAELQGLYGGGFPLTRFARSYHTHYDYPSTVGPKTPKALLDEISTTHIKLSGLARVNPRFWPMVYDKLLFQCTYHSNRLEGSTLDYSDTASLLKYGVMPSSERVTDCLMAQKHHEMVKSLQAVNEKKQLISPGLLCGLHAGLVGKEFPHPSLDNSELIKSLAGFVEAESVVSDMQTLCHWINTSISEGRRHALHIGAVAHHKMVRIQPFHERNAYSARLLVNLIMLRKELKPMVIRSNHQAAYQAAFQIADQGDIEPLITFLGEEMLATYRLSLKELEILID